MQRCTSLLPSPQPPLLSLAQTAEEQDRTTLGLSVLVAFSIASPWSHPQSPGDSCELPKPTAGERVWCNCQVTLI